MTAELAPSVKVVEINNPLPLYDPERHGYSQVAIVMSGAESIYVAGQFGIDQSGTPIGSDFATQAERALVNVETALAAGNAFLSDVVKLTVLIVEFDAAKLAAFEALVKRRFAPGPPTTLIPVSRLAADGMLIEIDAVAAIARSANRDLYTRREP